MSFHAQEVLQDGSYMNITSSLSTSAFLNSTTIQNIMSSLLPSIRGLSKSLLTYSQFLLLSSSKPALGGTPPSCTNPETSCQNTTAVADTCCFNSPGGLLLQVRMSKSFLGPGRETLANASLPDPILGLQPSSWPSRFLDNPRPLA